MTETTETFTLEDAMALSAEIADPDFIVRFWRMKRRLADLEAEYRCRYSRPSALKEIPCDPSSSE